MFFLFWQGCENGLHRVHENILNKGVFLRKIFFPYTFWSVSDNFSRSPRISWPGCRNCILPFYGKILRKMTFFGKDFCQSFSNLERKNLGFYRLFPIEFSKLRSNCPWETFEETEFFWTSSSFSHFRTLKEKNSGSWQRNVRRLVKTPFYFSVEEILREVFLLKRIPVFSEITRKKTRPFCRKL